MGWFWGSPDENQGSDKDPLRNLDPSLREFLRRESPVKDQSSPQDPSERIPSILKPHHPSDEGELPKTESEAKSSLPLVYQDGRYHDLWNSYQSPEEVDRYMKSDQEKIDEILEGFKYRRAEIGRVALENCAMEESALSDCWAHGSAKARLRLCRDENQAFTRCHMMQSKFLRALGYLSTFDRPAEVDEQIQMHADTLYHRMLHEERMTEAARAKGEPTPKFPPLLSQRQNSVPSLDTEKSRQSTRQPEILPSDLKKSIRDQLKTRLEELTPTEREVEEQAIKDEIRTAQNLGGNLTEIYQKQSLDRERRKEQGRETLGDKIISIFSFGNK